MQKIKIATRASKLALAQVNIVKKLLEKLSADTEICVVTTSTKGDRNKSDFLYKSKSVGLFTSEVENALLDGRADMAVHSLKDLPTAITPGLVIAAIPKRESAADALVASGKISALEDLPGGAAVGTSSLRRIAQLHRLRSDLKCVPLRGNVETRVSKVTSGEIDAVVVACAGLNRLGLKDKISVVFEPEQFIPSPGQGALSVQVRAEDTELIELVCQLDDEPTRIATQAERHILAVMHGGCSIPLGAYAKITNGIIELDAMIADTDGKNLIKGSRSAPVAQSKICAQKLAEELLGAGGKDILNTFRENKPD